MKGFISLFITKGYFQKAIFGRYIYKLKKDEILEYPAYLIAKQIGVNIAECSIDGEYVKIRIFTDDSNSFVHASELKSYFDISDEIYNILVKDSKYREIISQLQRMYIFNCIIANLDLYDDYGLIYVRGKIMIGKRIDKSHFDSIFFEKENVAVKVSAKDLCKFDDNDILLRELIGKKKLKYQRENNMTSMSAYESLEERCQINMDTIKKTISGKIKVTRNFLYKFTVGLGMSLEEANEYFELNGGDLRDSCLADYICTCALRDGDNINDFIREFELHTELKIGMRTRETK